ncbi:Tetratricopeptide-like helical [Penicillium hetheringtonii]|uniref:Tetratricopeptide-like helical n=1 Tax=Penicillium hetheringtonii TaxID=911720 RepID=A0AAD6GZP2_9EURO|nr:Tetratricopeptide-like helical [Penicillium hetheringtonii]
MERYLRSWRQDALNRGQHDSAIYIGDKVLALTNSDSDAFWLAQVHFSNNNFTRALALLSRKDLISRSTACRYLAAHCYIKQNQFDQALSILGEHNPADLIRNHNSRRKIQHLNGQSHVTLRNGKHSTTRGERGEDQEKDDANNNAFDRARDCYKDAVRIDVQCFEAFDQLMKNSLMSPAEELEFLESLDFDSVSSPDPAVAQEAADFTKMLYTTRLSKYSAPNILSDATETLSTHYNLAENPDILLARAEALFTQCRFAEALELTSSILSTSKSNELTTTNSPSMAAHSHLGHAPGVYPLHLACLYETGATNALFLLSHMLADHAPEEPYTYLAIGVYYLSVSKIAEARRFFSKASLLDPHSAPAWIGFAHTFAAEGSPSNNTSTLPSNLPSSPLGGDPLVLNELGVVYYHQGNLSMAVELFQQALKLAGSLQCEPGAWVATRANLGHALRRMGRVPDALREFDECLRVGCGGTSMGYSPFLGGGAGGSAAVATASGVGGYEDRGLVGSLHTSRGLLLLELARTTEAVTALHEAVRVLGASGGGDAAGGAGVAGTLLSRALEIWASEGHQKDRKAIDDGSRPSNSRSSTRSRETRGKERVRPDGSRRRIQADAFTEEWTDEVTHPATPDPVVTNSMEGSAEMELDEQADGLLRRALGRVRPSRQHRPAVPMTPEMNSDDTSVRSRGGWSGRSQSRQ